MIGAAGRVRRCAATANSEPRVGHTQIRLTYPRRAGTGAGLRDDVQSQSTYSDRTHGLGRARTLSPQPPPSCHLLRWCPLLPILPRSPSSPSPPARKPAGSARKARPQSARRQSSGKLPSVAGPSQLKRQPQGWSTSYQAGSSRYVRRAFNAIFNDLRWSNEQFRLRGHCE